MTIAILGIDLGKTTCSVAGLDCAGTVILRRRIQRFRLLKFLIDLPPCVVAMEACGGAHHVARFSQEFGHEPRLALSEQIGLKLCVVLNSIRPCAIRSGVSTVHPR